MATKKTAAPAAEVAEQFKESADAYIERLIKGHETLTTAFDTARARNARLAEKMIELMVAGQRDALELGKAYVGAPQDYSKNIAATMESLTVAQTRALELAKVFYREQVDASGELRDAAERSLAAVKGFVPPIEKFTSMFSPAAK